MGRGGEGARRNMARARARPPRALEKKKLWRRQWLTHSLTHARACTHAHIDWLTDLPWPVLSMVQWLADIPLYFVSPEQSEMTNENNCYWPGVCHVSQLHVAFLLWRSSVRRLKTFISINRRTLTGIIREPLARGNRNAIMENFRAPWGTLRDWIVTSWRQSFKWQMALSPRRRFWITDVNRKLLFRRHVLVPRDNI